jgi:thiol-disulfide isomerase/thioredoxin
MARVKSHAPARPTNWGRILTIGGAAAFVVGIGVFLITQAFANTNSGEVAAAPSAPSVTQSSNSNFPSAPNFTIQTIDGQTVSLAQEQGRVLGLFFMAGWCVSCQPEAHTWGQLYAKYHSKGLDVLIVDVEQSETGDDLLAFKSRARGGDHWWALDRDGALVGAFRIQSLDTTYIIGRDGRVTYYDYWPTSADVLERLVLQALQ